MMRSLRWAAVLLFVLMLSVPAHSALVLTLADTNRTVHIGTATTLDFFGTITNTGPDMLSGMKGLGAMIPNDPVTKIGLPDTIMPTWLWPSPLGPNDSYSGKIFTFSVASNAQPGNYQAYCRIDYSPASGPQVHSNNVYWYVSIVPEPSSILALLCGISGLGIAVRMRKQKPQ